MTYSPAKHAAVGHEEDNMETIADLDELGRVLVYAVKRLQRRRAALVASNQQAMNNGFRS